MRNTSHRHRHRHQHRLLILAALGLGACGAPTASAPDAAGMADARPDARPDASVIPDAPVDLDPRPPGVGLMHTLAQLDFLRAHRDQPPWQSAYQQLLQDADAALLRAPDPRIDFNVPFYYGDPAAAQAAKECLRQDALAAYALALGYQLADTSARRHQYAVKAISFLDAWATTNTSISGADGDLVAMYTGLPLLYAADLVINTDDWAPASRSAFTTWVSTVFRTSANKIKDHSNNWGAWGTLGAMASAALVGDAAGVADEVARSEARIASSIAANGELPEENLRTNSGIWYTYFALTSMTAAAQIARNVSGVDLFGYTSPGGRTIRMALDRHFVYAVHPDQWPYPLPGGIEGDLWRQLYPCADELEMPTVTGWPGTLFERMSDTYQVPEWRDWVVSSRPLKGYHAWIYTTLARQTP